MVYHTTPYFTSAYIPFVTSKSFFKASDRPNILLPQHLQDIRQTTLLLPHFKIPLILYFRLVEKQIKSGEITKRFLQMSHFLLHSFIKHSFWLLVLGNNDGDKIFLRFVLLLYVTLMLFCGKISSICWLLYKTGKWFLMIVLMLGNKGLYCMI